MVASEGESPESVEALVLIPVFHEGGDDSPLFGMVFVQSEEKFVFLGSPCSDLPGFDDFAFGTELGIDQLAVLVLVDDSDFFHRFDSGQSLLIFLIIMSSIK